MYKQSKFNFISNYNGGLRLYNSYAGVNSLLEVDHKNKDCVMNVISNPNQVEIHNEFIRKKLIELGYIVRSSENENLKLKLKLNDITNNNMLFLMIFPTGDCNFRCKYCYEKFDKDKMKLETADAIINYVRRNIYNYSGLNIAWFGGEPLKALDIVEYMSEHFINICKTAKRYYYSSMTTNGYNLDVATYNKLNKLKMYNYQITLDGLKDTHDKYRCLLNGGGTFDKIILNLDNIIKNCNMRFSNITIRINFTKESFEQLDELINFLNSKFSNNKHFNIAISLAGDWGGSVVSEVDDSFLNRNIFSKIIKRFAEKGKDLSYNNLLYSMTHNIGFCYANLRNSYIIDSEGNIYKCSVELYKKINQIGFIKKNGTFEIDVEKLASWLNFGKYCERSMCVNCNFLPTCFCSACPAKEVAKGELMKCPWTKESISDILQLFSSDIFNKLVFENT